MTLLFSFIICFSLYTKIPMPRVEWTKENMRFSICFFPLVGALAGLFEGLWILACMHFGIGRLTEVLVLAAIPIILTGGIHLDGFMDTMDAVNSWQDRERKLEILKDSHIGAFSVIMLLLYYLLDIAAMSSLLDRLSEQGLTEKEFFLKLLPFLLIPVFARAVTGTVLVFGKSARTGGIAYTFAEAGNIPAVRIVMVCWDVVLPILTGFINPPAGIGFAILAAGGAAFFLKDTQKKFGGITGDLCGCLILMVELLLLIGYRILLR